MYIIYISRKRSESIYTKPEVPKTPQAMEQYLSVAC